MKPKFSILTSSYNAAPYLADWASSILRQQYRPLEVIFTNDSSTDNTFQLIQSHGKAFQDIGIEFKYVQHDKRMHCGSSYRDTLAHATGEFFGILDSDDMLMDCSVEKVMQMYISHPKIAWIYTQFDWCNKSLNFVRKGFCKAPKSGQCLLDMGKNRIHGYSHWRTFSTRVPSYRKILCKGLKSSVDKYMGYQLEERAPGMFYNATLYRYRYGVKGSISLSEKSHEMWRRIINEAVLRRRTNKIKPFPIITVNEP